ncbi:MAG: flagellar hook-length control protein FliK [Deltaproteobacteria bacterium]|nr:flagellar hook-length control protein FliK [Deltaproteobacteria bacterium]
MLSTLALNLSADVGLSLVNDVMGAVSGNLSSQMLSASGNTGSSAVYGSSDFEGQGSFGKMLNNSISGLSNAASSVSDGGQNQGGAFQSAGGTVNVYGGGQAGNTAAETSAPVSSTGQQPNNGANAVGNNNGAQTENNISGSSPNSGNGYQTGQPVNNNTGGSSNSNAGKSVAKVSASNGDSPQASSKNGDTGHTSNGSAKSSKTASEKVGNTVLNGNANIRNGQNVYFIGNTNINFAGQSASAKKIDVKSGGTGSNGNASEGANSKSKPDVNVSLLNANGTQVSDGGSNAGNIGSNYSGINAHADNIKNINGKDYPTSGRNNAAGVSAYDSSSKSSDVAANKNTYNQNITDKTAANKSNSNSNSNSNLNSNTADANKINIFNANAADNGVKADVNMSVINAQNAKTLNEDIKNNAHNSESIKNSSAAGLSLSGSAVSSGINSAGSLKAGDSGSLSSNLFGAAGSAVSAGAGSGSPSASGGNSSGFSLTGGGVSGLEDDTAGETTGSLAINSVMFMLRRNVQSAVITLNPASLGTVKINVSLNPANSLNAFNQAVSSGNAITVNMLAQNEAAKNALQASSDSLQNALKNQGFSTINLNISTGSGYNNGNGGGANESFNNAFASGNAGYNSGFSNGAAETQTVSAGTNGLRYGNPNALVDYFV